MRLTEQIAKHLRDVHFGGNWTSVNMKETLADVNWQEAIVKIYSFNTIASLVYHIHYYVSAVLNVFRGGPLDAHDKFSFDLPPIQNPEDWESLLRTTWSDAEDLAKLIEQFPESRLYRKFH